MSKLSHMITRLELLAFTPGGWVAYRLLFVLLRPPGG
jgi:hypothetical protein